MRKTCAWSRNFAPPAVRIATEPRLDRALARARDEEGQSLLEFAYVVPVLLTFVFGIIVFGVALNNYLVLADATSVGARVLSISRGQTTDPCAQTVEAVEGAAPRLTTGNLKFSFVLNGTAYSGLSCSGAQMNLVQAQNAQVTVTYPCNLKFFGFNPAPNCTLTAQTTERVQ
jgi:Flp pilus assembly protein TadG